MEGAFRVSIAKGKIILNKVDFWRKLFGCAKRLYDPDEAGLDRGEGDLRRLLIDTYAILAAATNSLTPTAMKDLLEVKAGRIKGAIRYLVAMKRYTIGVKEGYRGLRARTK
ncbi:TPA: hypothetical protein EYP26_06290 [Candidatus Bathyarchaeota archaeon]|nr:hypothetical protein [Candidatus Bathyarchaeota archaeon]